MNNVISAPGFLRERGEGIVDVEADVGGQPFHGGEQRLGHVESVDLGGGGKPFREIDGPDAAGGSISRSFFGVLRGLMTITMFQCQCRPHGVDLVGGEWKGGSDIRSLLGRASAGN